MPSSSECPVCCPQNVVCFPISTRSSYILVARLLSKADVHLLLATQDYLPTASKAVEALKNLNKVVLLGELREGQIRSANDLGQLIKLLNARVREEENDDWGVKRDVERVALYLHTPDA